jgi:Rieske 2Fe-2S family protein
VRSVSLLPLGPETTQLTAEWLFSPSTLHNPDFNLKNVTDFATLVMEQDARVCELNQRGLRAIPHGQGILVPHEAEVYHFQQWVRSEMGEH